MSASKTYEMLFQLNSQMGSTFSGAFQKAQKELAETQKQIESLNKSQADIKAYQKQQEAVDKTAAKFELLTKQYNNIQQEMDETGNHSADMKNKLLAKQQQIDKTNTSLTQHKQKLEQMGSALEDAGIDTKNLTEESKRLGQEVDDLRDKEANFGSTGAMAFETVGSAIVAAGITTALKEMTEYFAKCCEASMEFESAITGVAKTTDLTDEELASMSDAIKQMSTEIPATTTEIAAVAEAAGQLGIQKDSLLDFTEVMTMLGTATNMTAEEAATALAKFANITGMSADNYDRLGAVIVDLGNNFATTESDITTMATRLASAGTLAGLTESEILALAASMSSVGIEAEAGGTAMTQTLNAIETAVASGGNELDEFARIAGMSAGEFAATWKSDAMTALTAFISGLGDLDEQGESTVLVLDELGLTGVRQSNMLKSLGLAADQMTSAVNTANTAWEENVALTNEASKRYATTESQLAMMQNAYTNLQASIGDAFNPVLKELYALATKALNAVSQFVSQHPTLVRAVTTLVGTFMTLATALTSVLAVIKIIKALNLAALFTGPTGAILGAIAAVSALAAVLVTLAAVLVTLASATDSEAAQVREMTESSREQYYELQNLKAEYEEACDVYGDTSDEAQYLAWQVDELTSSFEANKQTLSDYLDECQSLNDSLNESLDTNRENYEAIGDNEGTTLALVHRLQDLASQTTKTTATQEEMKAVISGLNDLVPELALNYDDVASGATDVGSAIETMVKAQAAASRYEAAQDGMVTALNAQYEAQQQLNDLQNQQASAQERYNAARTAYYEALSQATKYDTTGTAGFAMAFSAEAKELTAAEEALNGYDEQIAETQGTLDQATTDYEMYLNVMTGYVEGTDEATDSTEEFNNAITSVETSVSSLVAAYNEAYNAALESVTGQYNLWDEADSVIATSAGTINSNLQSQITYWQNYNTNLESLRERTGDIEGLSDVISSFADGSTDSVNAVAGMAAASDADLATMVANWKELQAEQDSVADNIAELKTDFTTQMDELGAELASDIEAMDMSSESAQAARATIQAFIDGATGMTSSVQIAYGNIARVAANALRTATGTTYSGKTLNGLGQKYASGTQSAKPGFALVGEEGPELVYFNGGEQVMTAEETEAMKSGISAEAITFSPMLMDALANRSNAVYTDIGDSGGGSTAISITFQIEGNTSADIAEQLRSYGDEFAERVREVMEDVNSETGRRVYR